AVAAQHVRPAVQVVVEEEGAELQERPGRGFDSLGHGGVGELHPLHIVEPQERVGLVGEVTDDYCEPAGAIDGRIDPHAAARLSLRISNAAEQAALLELAVALVAEEKVADAVVGDDDIRPAVIVNITNNEA